MAPRLLIALLAALPAAVPAHAQLYKWVDERGVTNYSNQLPVNPRDARKLAVVEDKVSVYTPDPALLGAIEAERQGRGVSARMAELERQPDAGRQSRLVAAVAALPASGPCSIWPSDCLDPLETYYAPAYFAVGPRFRPRPRPHLGSDYFRPGLKPGSRSAGHPPSRSRGRNSMHSGPKP